MDANQQRFYDFFMERVKEDCAGDARALLQENFKRQDEGTFTQEYMRQGMPRLMSFLKPECVEEFQQAAAHMSSTLKD